MTTPLYLTRAQLRRDPAIEAIAKVLLPATTSNRTASAHHLVWSLFAGDHDAKRDFLWREDKNGTFFILSSRRPGENPIFESKTKEFAPELEAGDMLRFTLRANATRCVKEPGAKRGKRADVVMAQLKAAAKDERAKTRPGVIVSAGREWLEAQGTRHGFALAEDSALRVDGYEQLRLDRGDERPIEMSVLEFEGVLEVKDPASFLGALSTGFGRAKAFGCGLMLIRRA